MARSEFALVKHHLQQALDKTSTLTKWGSAAHEQDVYALLADVAARERDAVAVRHYASLAEEMAARSEHTLYQGIAHRAWGVAHRLAGEYAQAEARLARALALFGELDTRWQMGLTLFELGELAVTQTHGAAARDYFSRALSLFEEMRARPDVARTRAALDAVADQP